MKVAILYNRLFEFDGSCLTVGGIQTYLLKLAGLIADMGWEPIIFQLAEADFEREVGQVIISGKHGIPIDSSGEVLGRFLANFAQEWIGSDDGILVFGTDTFFVKTAIKSIAIQHGVFWDLPCTEMPRALDYLRVLPTRYNEKLNGLVKGFRESRINRIRRAWMSAGKDINDANNKIQFMVCVDYNYYNVCKAQGKRLTAHTWIIPNFADYLTPEEIFSKQNSGATVRILFARRFFWYRGTRLIAPVFGRIISEFPHVSITMAGDGPDEDWLREYFRGLDRVVFSKYVHHESKSVLLSHDVAVVSSLGSEGTSLSAIEAMGAGCTVVATCVGGLTNIIIDGHNGKLALPDEESLYAALSQVVANAALRKRLAGNAYETVKDAFSIELWREKWRQVLTAVSAYQ